MPTGEQERAIESFLDDINKASCRVRNANAEGQEK